MAQSSEKTEGESSNSLLSNSEVKSTVSTRPISVRAKEALNTLYICCFLESLAFGIVLPVQSLFLITDLGLTSWQVGLTLAVYYFSHMIGGFVSGRLSDATGRRPVLVFAYGWEGIAYLFVALLAFAPISSMLEPIKMGLVIAQRFFSGISGGSSLPAQTYVMDICSARTRSQPLSKIGAIYGGTFAVGSLIGGFLVRHLSVTRFAIFITGAGLCFTSCSLAFLFLPESLPASRRRLPNLHLAGITKDFSEINLGLWSMWTARFGLSWAIYGLIAVYPFFVRSHFGESEIDFKLGLFMFVGAISQMITLLVFFAATSRLLGKHFTLIVASAAAAALLAILPAYTRSTSGADVVFYHVVWKVMFHSVLAVADAALPDALGLYVGERYLGFAQGFLGIFKSTAAVVGTLVTGLLYESDSKFQLAPFAVMAGCCGFAALMGLTAKFFAKAERDHIGNAKKSDEEDYYLDTVDTETTRL